VNRAARVCLSVARRIRSQIGASTCGTMTGQQYLSVYLRDAGRSACQDLFAAAVLMHHSLYSCCAGRKKRNTHSKSPGIKAVPQQIVPALL